MSSVSPARQVDGPPGNHERSIFAESGPEGDEQVHTVGIVSPLPVGRLRLEQQVARAGGVALVASVATVSELDRQLPVDVVLLDLDAIGNEQALTVIGALTQHSGVVVTSSWRRPPTVVGAMRAGARACLSWPSPPAVVLAAVTAVMQGGIYIGPDLVESWSAELAPPGVAELSGLTPREVETLRWIALGFTHGQIATRMGLTEATVNTYAKRIRAKLNAGNKAGLTRRAIELGHLATFWDSHPAA